MQFEKRTYILLGLLAVLLVVSGVVTYFVVTQNTARVSDDTRELFTGASDTITYIDLNGNKLALEDFLGQIIVVASWASWSPFSATDLVALETFARDYEGEDVVFIAINRKETKEQAARYIATLPPFTHLKLVIDTEDRFYTSVGGYAMPETVIFDSVGEVVFHDRGVTSIDRITATLASLARDN
jgi:thiol-disulfide isomerase/thioredoxin